MHVMPPHLDILIRRLQSTSIAYQTRLAERIIKLSTAFAEDYDGHTLSAQSLAGLVDFLEASPASGYPDLTATPAGDVYAEWHGPEGRRLTIEFLASGDARYLLFRPNPKHPQRVDRRLPVLGLLRGPLDLGPREPGLRRVHHRLGHPIQGDSLSLCPSARGEPEHRQETSNRQGSHPAFRPHPLSSP